MHTYTHVHHPDVTDVIIPKSLNVFMYENSMVYH